MTTPAEKKSLDPQQEQHAPSMWERFITFMTGTSANAFARAPSGERKKVYIASLPLVLVSCLVTYGVGVALDITRGGFAPIHLPACLLAGGLVFALDQSFLRNHWERAGRFALLRRGYQTEAGSGLWLLSLHIAARIGVSLVVGFAVAGFQNLAIFEQDTNAYIAEQNREHNRPLYEAAAKRVDGVIAEKRAEIARLGGLADAIVNDTRNTHIANQAVATQQIQALNKERAELQQHVNGLKKERDRQVHNMSAEETGQARHDGSQTIPGRGRRYAHAANMVNHLNAQISSAETRIGQIDAGLARIPQGGAPTHLPAQAQNRLNEINTQRTNVMSELDKLLAERDAAVRDSVGNDKDFVPLPEGLIVRGKAIDALASTSPWMQARITSIIAFLLVLDLSALITIAMLPVPMSIAIGEVMETDVVIQQTIAQAEQTMAEPWRTMQEMRVQRVEVENASDARITRQREQMQTRRDFHINVRKRMTERGAEDREAA